MSETKESTYQCPLSFKHSIERVLGTGVTFFHVCKGERPGGYFVQKEAWEAYLIAHNSTRRAIQRVVDDGEDWR